jgi:peptide-methionine (S)-S-oxide reductase
MTPFETITLGGGCFWCTEAVFELVPGVQHVESGYCNGHVIAPSYEQVCTGTTGHNEVIRIQFDPQQVSLPALLAIFFTIHDPTSLNRQGQDSGTQYRSGIYVHSAAQTAIAQESAAHAQQHYADKIVTEITPEHNYSAAEPYHQHYFAQNPQRGYCAMVIAPKVEQFKRDHPGA